MLRTATVILVLALAAMGLAAPATAGAEERRAPRSRKVLQLEELTVEGKFQKPEAFYILPRANLHLDESERAESFLPKIVKSQEDPLF
jgi:hypothetical protein